MSGPVTVAGRPLRLGDPAAFRAGRVLDVLIPTRGRPAELATALAGLAAQHGGPAGDDGPVGDRDRWGDRDSPVAGFGVAVSDQSDGEPSWGHPAVATMVRVLRHRGHPVLLSGNLPRRGLAHQRAKLLAASDARYVLYLDDDVWLAPGTLDRLLSAITRLGCGFVGNAVHGLSYVDEHRPDEEAAYEPWVGPVLPEDVRPGTPRWGRHRLHDAANLLHVTQRLALPVDRWQAYKVAWVGACVLYDRAKLRSCGGFDFWDAVPAEHAGEDVAAQLAVARRYGGAGILPSGAYHLESPTTVTGRSAQCHELLAPVGHVKSKSIG